MIDKNKLIEWIVRYRKSGVNPNDFRGMQPVSSDNLKRSWINEAH